MITVETYFVLHGLLNGQRDSYAVPVGGGKDAPQADGWYWLIDGMIDGNGPWKSQQQAREMGEKELAKWREIARGSVERHLGDVCEGDDSPDSIYDEAYVIAHDALWDAGVQGPHANLVAQEQAQLHAQP